MIYEYRHYRPVPGKLPALHHRFETVTLALFARHGIRPLAFFEPVIGPMWQLHYLLEWESMAEREERWEAFAGDPDWLAAKQDTERDGPLVADVDIQLWRRTGYSPPLPRGGQG